MAAGNEGQKLGQECRNMGEQKTITGRLSPGDLTQECPRILSRRSADSYCPKEARSLSMSIFPCLNSCQGPSPLPQHPLFSRLLYRLYSSRSKVTSLSSTLPRSTLLRILEGRSGMLCSVADMVNTPRLWLSEKLPCAHRRLSQALSLFVDILTNQKG